MYCQKCGADNLENAAICQSCGGVFVYSKPIKTSGMAITSMILSISTFALLGVFGIVWIIALVFGIISLNRINKSGGQLRGKGFAITGIATSSAGLAVLLTIIGVLLFINSATTFSLHKKLKTLEDSKLPEMAGMVQIIYNGSDPNSNCAAPLFTPEQLQTESEIIGKIECRSEIGKPVVVQWKFTGEEDGLELYDFSITAVVDDDKTALIEKWIEYDGSEEIVYKDKTMKIAISQQE
ncbi:MAG: hypothetical protein A2Y10_00260 [Planctomycetes bacterium GWF2_41_51]|nr:MAG: hypothetical protein A2Y10_00260 [Planctomycetes bacterium GWF2_41_51]HBG27526.1 hypothetical protein [Phycisphaerales bacterium]